jgi:hypothetical protein
MPTRNVLTSYYRYIKKPQPTFFGVALETIIRERINQLILQDKNPTTIFLSTFLYKKLQDHVKRLSQIDYLPDITTYFGLSIHVISTQKKYFISIV